MNITRRVFVTSAIDNLDESGRCEFHGTAMTLTSHLSPGNLGENPPPLCLDNLDQTEIKIPSLHLYHTLMNMQAISKYQQVNIKYPDQDLISKQVLLSKHGSTMYMLCQLKMRESFKKNQLHIQVIFLIFKVWTMSDLVSV